MLMIDPERCAIIAGATARLIRKTPRAFTRITCSHSSRLVSARSPTPAMPALLKRTSIRPCSASTAAASSWVRTSSATSTVCVTPSAEPSMSAATTRAPSAAKSSALARPIPEPAPVTMQTLPSSRMSAAARSDEARQPERDQDDGAVRGVDPEGLDLREHENVLHEPEEHDAGERPEHAPTSALERDAADDRRSEDGEDQVVALVRGHGYDLPAAPTFVYFPLAFSAERMPGTAPLHCA